MSFSTAFQSFRARTQSCTGFTTKQIIPNPYSIDANPDIILREGLGYKVGGSNTFAQQFNIPSDRQQIGIVVSKLYIATDSNADVMLGVVESMKDELETLRVWLLQQTEMSGIQQIEYMSTDQIDFVDRYIYTTIYFDVVYSASLPC